MDTAALAQELRRERAALLRQADGVDTALLSLRPADDGWAISEVLAHLIAVDRHWLREALALRNDPRRVFIPFDDARWKREHPEARTAEIGAMRAALDASHRAVVETLVALPPGDLLKAGKHPRGHVYTVMDVFRRYPAHDRDHARQIAEIRAELRA